MQREREIELKPARKFDQKISIFNNKEKDVFKFKTCCGINDK
jgi:hypothetical protein